MAVYRRSYRAYTGPRTADWARFLVIARFAVLDLVASRAVLLLLGWCFLPFLVEAGFIYVSHSPAARALISMDTSAMFTVDERFFLRAVGIQGFLAFVLTAWIGPTLVAPDLANGAVPLYLSRPLSRAEYVLGKITVLFGLLSLVTWVPNLILFFLKAGMESGWLAAHLRIGWAILAGSVLWIAVLCLLSLAISASVKRRQAASLFLCALFFIGSGIGEMWHLVIGNAWGRLANLLYVVGRLWTELFGLNTRGRIGGVRLNDPANADLPSWAAWLAIVTLCAFCVWLLDRRVRAREIVR